MLQFRPFFVKRYDERGENLSLRYTFESVFMIFRLDVICICLLSISTIIRGNPSNLLESSSYLVRESSSIDSRELTMLMISSSKEEFQVTIPDHHHLYLSPSPSSSSSSPQPRSPFTHSISFL